MRKGRPWLDEGLDPVDLLALMLLGLAVALAIAILGGLG